MSEQSAEVNTVESPEDKHIKGIFAGLHYINYHVEYSETRFTSELLKAEAAIQAYAEKLADERELRLIRMVKNQPPESIKTMLAERKAQLEAKGDSSK